MIEIECPVCGELALKPTGGVNRSRSLGKPVYCSRECCDVARTTGRNAKGWHERRFEQRDGALEKKCLECGRSMWLPPSKIDEYIRCGGKCTAAYRARVRDSRLRDCKTCGQTFRARSYLLKIGQGSFCSQRCNTTAREAMLSAESTASRIATMAGMRAEGKINYARGEDSPCWKGGPEARKLRLRESGKQAAWLRDYRSRNPHKVREFSQRRKGRKLGRLEYGTIPRIGTLQKWKCAICRVSVKTSYHVDHITPLAKGGRHAASNIQLLCGPCNFRKSAKDPIDYMRSLGRLL